MERPLKFHTDTKIFYKDGVLREEPEETLEELLAEYEDAAARYREFTRILREKQAPYRRLRWIGNVEPTFIEDSSRSYRHCARENAAWADITLDLSTDFTSPGEPDRIVALILAHPHYKPEGIRLNITGSNLHSLKGVGFDEVDVLLLLCNVFRKCGKEGIHILEVRSGGQSGVDKAAIGAAQRCGLKCSVLAPKGYKFCDENGTVLEGKDRFIRRFQEEYIDYDAWDEADPDGCFDYGMAEFNGFNGLDMLEYDIDLKIMYLNRQEAAG